MSDYPAAEVIHFIKEVLQEGLAPWQEDIIRGMLSGECTHSSVEYLPTWRCVHCGARQQG